VTLAAALEGKSVEPVIDTGTVLVTPENAEEFLAGLE
jgi:ABC-type sugar transport system substrate-binding protein